MVAVGMVHWRLTTTARGSSSASEQRSSLIAIAGVLGLTKVLEERLGDPLGDAGLRARVAPRRAPLLGLVFFLAWTVVYIALWVIHPEQAFTGLPAEPRFSDFFYYAVCTAVISPPGDIFATSRGARSATMIEMLSSFALVTAYLASFVDWQPPPEAQPPEE